MHLSVWEDANDYMFRVHACPPVATR
jgi:hypothetical protein